MAHKEKVTKEEFIARVNRKEDEMKKREELVWFLLFLTLLFLFTLKFRVLRFRDRAKVSRQKVLHGNPRCCFLHPCQKFCNFPSANFLAMLGFSNPVYYFLCLFLASTSVSESSAT